MEGAEARVCPACGGELLIEVRRLRSHQSRYPTRTLQTVRGCSGGCTASDVEAARRVTGGKDAPLTGPTGRGDGRAGRSSTPA